MEYVTDTPISPSEIYDKLKKSSSGSVLLHYAVVRRSTDDKVTSKILFERNGDMEAELKSIADRMRSKWDIEDVLLVRRLGTVGPEQIISLVAVSSPRSKDAFEACPWGIEHMRKMATIKKMEVFEE